MKITAWGCRGSLPIPGKNTLRFGGNSTCFELQLDDGNVIIIDAGTGIRGLGRKLVREKKQLELYLVLTHSHWDHLMGFPFFVPAYLPDYKIRVRGGPIAKESLRGFLDHQMDPPFFPVDFSAMKADFDFTPGLPQIRQVGSTTITPTPLSHPNGGYGYKFEENGKTFVFLTDNELEHEHEGGRSMQEYIDFCEGAELVLHDAQYTPEEYKRYATWGHSSFDSAINLAIYAGVPQLGLIHHDPDHKDDDMDRIGEVCRRIVEKKKKPLDCFVVKEGVTLEL